MLDRKEVAYVHGTLLPWARGKLLFSCQIRISDRGAHKHDGSNWTACNMRCASGLSECLIIRSYVSSTDLDLKNFV